MAASLTVSQLASALNSSANAPQLIRPIRGVVTLTGYGISIRVDRGHLVIEDGIGSARQRARFARVGHGLRRVIVVGSDGAVSLAALQWLADQDASLVMLNRNGSVLFTTGPVGPRDARLRRAQAVAQDTDLAVHISRELIHKKLVEQARTAEAFHDSAVAATITAARNALKDAHTIPAIRHLEAQAAAAYWACWRTLPIMFPRKDLARVPDHWRVFGTRHSPISNSPRLSINPPNAMLNYLYALLESEARLAAAALGLDPGLGLLHADTPSRDSLACDLMEPIRPLVDAYVLNWVKSEPLRREWFFEQRDGTCRLMAAFARQLSESAQTWARAVAPIAESVTKTVWSSIHRPVRQPGPATRLTQQHRRDAKGAESAPTERAPAPSRVCRDCGAATRRDYRVLPAVRRDHINRTTR